MTSANSTPAPDQSSQRRASLVFAPFAAIGWLALALLGLAVRLALFPRHRTAGAVAILWGAAFTLFLWAGTRSVGLHDPNAILFGLVGGGAIALFVYLRGAGLEQPPLEQPGAAFRRRLARRRERRALPPSHAYTPHTRELSQARLDLVRGDLASALFSLREAERVAVAQGKPDELRQVAELVSEIAAKSGGRTKAGAERVAERVDRALHPPVVHPYTREQLRALAAADTHATTTRELAAGRRALDGGDFATALFDLQEARRVAVAQRRVRELLEIEELATSLATRSDGRTRAAGEKLAARVESDLQTF
jgi:hypothetical protein